MSGPLKRILAAVVARGAVVAFAFWLFARLAPHTPADDGRALPAAEETDQEADLGVAVAKTPIPVPPSNFADEEADLGALRSLCGRPWVADFGRDCLAALGRRYGHTVPDPWDKRPFRWWPIMLAKPVTWAEVFDSPAAALANVRDAVRRSECLVPHGRFRLDLRRTCDADDMVRLAILRRECAVSLGRYERMEDRQDWWDIHQIPVDRAPAQPEYYWRMADRDNRWFGGMWRLAKCRTLPEGALDAIGPSIAEYHHHDFDFRLMDMMEAAARLGSDWALSAVLRYEPRVVDGQPRNLLVDDAGIEDVRGSRPVLAELLRMRRAEGGERVKHAIAAYMLGASLGVAVHPHGVERITGPPDATWRTAAPKAARWLVEQGWTLVVYDDEPRWFERPEQVADGQPWFDYWMQRRVAVLSKEAPTATERRVGPHSTPKPVRPTHLPHPPSPPPAIDKRPPRVRNGGP